MAAPVQHTSNGVRAESEVVDLGKRGTMATGICFLDHMIDQLTSHGQLGVSVRVAINKGAEPEWLPEHVDYAGNTFSERPHDRDIFLAAGKALGAALRHVVDGTKASKLARGEPPAQRRKISPAPGGASTTATAVFCCPLDEAFCESTVELLDGPAGSATVELAPYGTMPPAGRRWIGCYRCEYTTLFWEQVATSLGCRLTLRKVRGHNAHHVVESAFKAFARSFRAALDGLADTGGHGHGLVQAGEGRAARWRALGELGKHVPPAAPRVGETSRSTKETSITVSVDLDRAPPRRAAEATASSSTASLPPCLDGLSTGVALMDRIYGELRSAAGIAFSVECRGDTYIDDHHTAEDVSIALGQCLNAAIGSKAGVCRMACALGEADGAVVRVVIDLSNRPSFTCDIPLDEEYVGGDDECKATVCGGANTKGDVAGRAGWALTCEMLLHTFESISLESRSTVHVELIDDPNAGSAGHTKALAIATARAFGAALGEAVRVDPRRAGKVASSKGTLSK